MTKFGWRKFYYCLGGLPHSSSLQAAKYGDTSRALRNDFIVKDDLIELGEALKSKIIIADLSGMDAQDVAITEFILPKIIKN